MIKLEYSEQLASRVGDASYRTVKKQQKKPISEVGEKAVPE